jgi:DNA-3-methyladenine glycosylase II
VSIHGVVRAVESTPAATAPLIESLVDIETGLSALRGIDPRLAGIIDRAGAVPLRRQPAGYRGLASIIVSQMVSRASASAIWARLEASLGAVEPVRVLAVPDEGFRAAGLSRAKVTALRETATACLDGRLDLGRLGDVGPEEAMKTLTAVRGVGPWTAEVYLLFCIGHRDLFPAGDVALQAAAQHAFGLDRRPDTRALRDLAEAWRPWRGVAARLLWAYYAACMGREVTPSTG